MKKRLNYLRRILKAYLTKSDSQLTFWHGDPAIHPDFLTRDLGPYYMVFREKADYKAYMDDMGIPMLNYHGEVGLQYNPIAIAQYGLGNFNKYLLSHDDLDLKKFINASNWLTDQLQLNTDGIWVWNHLFDWEYRDTLKSPWYSALSQGQGISCLLRAHKLTDEKKYLEAAEKALESFFVDMDQGGVIHRDDQGWLWLEEAIVHPPTHILNGFLWAIWGLYDYYIYTGDLRTKEVYDQGIKTLIHNLPSFDTGFWSLYEHADKKMQMLASPFYHRLHIVQLKIMSQLSGEKLFSEYADKWQKYQDNFIYYYSALFYKAVFKIIYY